MDIYVKYIILHNLNVGPQYDIYDVCDRRIFTVYDMYINRCWNQVVLLRKSYIAVYFIEYVGFR